MCHQGGFHNFPMPLGPTKENPLHCPEFSRVTNQAKVRTRHGPTLHAVLTCGSSTFHFPFWVQPQGRKRVYAHLLAWVRVSGGEQRAWRSFSASPGFGVMELQQRECLAASEQGQLWLGSSQHQPVCSCLTQSLHRPLSCVLCLTLPLEGSR